MHSAIPYLKPDLSGESSASDLIVSESDFPASIRLGNGLLACYLVEEGEHATYVQNRHLRDAQMSLDKLHHVAIANLVERCRGNLQLHEFTHASALTIGGNFEASLLLVNAVWDSWISNKVENGFLAVVPARDVLLFCDSESANGRQELAKAVDRVWPEGDHLISKQIFRRVAQGWVEDV